MIIENIFESVCRRLLQEKTLDLGKIEFSPQRKDGAPKNEPNTDLEEEILAYLGDAVDEGDIIPEEISSILSSLVKSKEYGDFFHAPDVEFVYRGIGRLPREKVANWVGVDPTELEDTGEANVSFIMSPLRGAHSSWTKDSDIAEKFSRRGGKFDNPQDYTQDYGYKPSQEVLKLKKEHEDLRRERFELRDEIHRLQDLQRSKNQNYGPHGIVWSDEIMRLLRKLSHVDDVTSEISRRLFNAREEDMKAWKKLQKKEKKKTMSAYLDVVVTASVKDNPGKFLDLHSIMGKIKLDQFRGYSIQKEVISLSPVRVFSIAWKPASKKRISAPWSS